MYVGIVIVEIICGCVGFVIGLFIYVVIVDVYRGMVFYVFFVFLFLVSGLLM